MVLTAVEKVAGRAFRDDVAGILSRLNATNPPHYVVPSYLAAYRHLCPKRRNLSTAIELKECYILSPIFSAEGISEGRFGYIYREGRCLNCGRLARSASGRLVDGQERPPLTGRGMRS